MRTILSNRSFSRDRNRWMYTGYCGFSVGREESLSFCASSWQIIRNIYIYIHFVAHFRGLEMASCLQANNCFSSQWKLFLWKWFLLDEVCSTSSKMSSEIYFEKVEKRILFFSSFRFFQSFLSGNYTKKMKEMSCTFYVSLWKLRANTIFLMREKFIFVSITAELLGLIISTLDLYLYDERIKTTNCVVYINCIDGNFYFYVKKEKRII